MLLTVAALAFCAGCHLPQFRSWGGWAIERGRRIGRRKRLYRPLAAPPAELLGSPDLLSLAFDYQRAVLELDDIDPAAKTRALFLVNRVIVPLLRSLRLDDLTPRLEEGIAELLAVQFPIDPEGVVYVFRDLIRWCRVNAERRRSARSSGGA